MGPLLRHALSRSPSHSLDIDFVFEVKHLKERSILLNTQCESFDTSKCNASYHLQTECPVQSGNPLRRRCTMVIYAHNTTSTIETRAALWTSTMAKRCPVNRVGSYVTSAHRFPCSNDPPTECRRSHLYYSFSQERTTRRGTTSKSSSLHMMRSEMLLNRPSRIPKFHGKINASMLIHSKVRMARVLHDPMCSHDMRN